MRPCPCMQFGLGEHRELAGFVTLAEQMHHLAGAFCSVWNKQKYCQELFQAEVPTMCLGFIGQVKTAPFLRQCVSRASMETMGEKTS